MMMKVAMMWENVYERFYTTPPCFIHLCPVTAEGVKYQNTVTNADPKNCTNENTETKFNRWRYREDKIRGEIGMCSPHKRHNTAYKCKD